MTAVSGDRAVVTVLKKGLKKARAYFYDRQPTGWKLIQTKWANANPYEA